MSGEESERALLEGSERALRNVLAGATPTVAAVLGSGLGSGPWEEVRSIPYAELPGWPVSSVEGHAGEVVLGKVGRLTVLGLHGRPHLYEGWSPEAVTRPVRVLRRLGVGTLLLTNAAGSLDPRVGPGSLVLVADHLNLLWRGPLRIGRPGHLRDGGVLDSGSPRGGDAGDADPHSGGRVYDADLRARAREVARAARIELREGVYAAVAGPSYETPAEVRMLRRLGATLVGMSTVPEALAARAAGMRCGAISVVTNLAAGIGRERPSHADVLEVADRARPRLERLLHDTIVAIA